MHGINSTLKLSVLTALLYSYRSKDKVAGKSLFIFQAVPTVNLTFSFRTEKSVSKMKGTEKARD